MYFLFRYNKLTKNILDLAKKIKEMDSKDPFRASATAQLLEKLYLLFNRLLTYYTKTL